ncbi:hypothetical protein AAFF_G00202080 [Aldrovandia affinis]|uniref:Uncharacterized protein n=1 Tax=Aldrovandia affinis TaxID=143900 RepID=A0AAD7SY09_9TELE|nr:hypothetical protein AAFF_G00202080 [Aldrovandia affinis]
MRSPSPPGTVANGAKRCEISDASYGERGEAESLASLLTLVMARGNSLHRISPVAASLRGPPCQLDFCHAVKPGAGPSSPLNGPPTHCPSPWRVQSTAVHGGAR